MSIEAMPATSDPVVAALGELTDAVRGLQIPAPQFTGAEREQLAEVMHRANANAPTFAGRWLFIADTVADFIEGKYPKLTVGEHE